MKIQIYKNEEEINIDNIFYTNFSQIVEDERKSHKPIELDFSSFRVLQGNKPLLEMAFKDTKQEMIYG